MSAGNTPHVAHSRTEQVVVTDDDATREALIGTARWGRPSNVSWGAVFAGVVTFLAVTVLLSLVTAGIGLGGEGVAAGIWSIVAVALALAAAGYVAGVLALRSGLIHGFLTWATSLVAALALAAWLSMSVLGAVGGAFGQIASSLTGGEVTQVVEDAQENIDEEDVEQAEDQAAEVAEGAQAGAWWTFAGLLVGAAIAAGAGALGVRSVVSRTETVRTRTTAV